MSPFCTNCGSEVEENWNVCVNCGKDLKEKAVTQPQVQPIVQSPPQPQRVQPYQQRYRPTGGYPNTYGAVALICGLIGLFCGFGYGGIIFGIVAIIMGGLGLSRDESTGMAIAGLILGILGIVCFLLFYVFIFSWFSFFPFGGF
ncbi:MAG: zinc-ribbon domain-containing protein [Promethearchaeota archaeon]|jgi:hypothetical protein